MRLTKQEFEQILLDAGYVCEKDSQYPSVIVYGKADIKKVYRQIKTLSGEKGYTSSFAVRLFRDGIATYPHEDAGSGAIDTGDGDGIIKDAGATIVNGEAAEDVLPAVCSLPEEHPSADGESFISGNPEEGDASPDDINVMDDGFIEGQMSVFDMFGFFDCMGDGSAS